MNQLKNRYFVLRHGESKANVANIIISNMENGVKEEFGLTDHGRQQIKEVIQKAKEDSLLNKDSLIYSSPFSRTKETADIAKEILGAVQPVLIDDRLCERNFGNLENTSISNYQKVWEQDKNNALDSGDNIESAQEVQNRTQSFLEDLEKMYVDKTILIISHGDPLQILQTAVLGQPAETHQDLPSLNTGQMRKLN